ncbi:MAG: hypothetical protein ABMB14_32510 [Myxococcota bacterium]
MNIKTQLVFAALFLLGGCPVPTTDTGTKDTIPTNDDGDADTDTDSDTDTTIDTSTTVTGGTGG